MHLLQAVASGDIQQARQTIEKGAYINCCDFRKGMEHKTAILWLVHTV